MSASKETKEAALQTMMQAEYGPALFIALPKEFRDKPKDEETQKLAILINPADPTVLLDMLSTVSLHLLQKTIEMLEEDWRIYEDKVSQLPKNERTKAVVDDAPPMVSEMKKALYDHYNFSASKVLELFAPEFELRPDLTAEAILKAENEILMEQDKGAL